MFLTVSTFYVSHVQNVITESSEKIKNVLPGRKHIDKIVYSIYLVRQGLAKEEAMNI